MPGWVTVVLVEPTQPENVGAVARAMHNMGVKKLRLVKPCPHLSADARKLAVHSESILDQARVFASLAEAIHDQQLVCGTTARPRERSAQIIPLTHLDQWLPKESARIALVFGRESSGLSNEEISLCHVHTRIETHGKDSLNLAQAVVVTLYELSKLYPPSQTPEASNSSSATSSQIETLKAHLFPLLQTIGFLKPLQEATIRQSIADLIGRSRLSESDVRLLHGCIHRVEVSLRRAQEPTDRHPLPPPHSSRE